MYIYSEKKKQKKKQTNTPPLRAGLWYFTICLNLYLPMSFHERCTTCTT